MDMFILWDENTHCFNTFTPHEIKNIVKLFNEKENYN